MAFHSNALTLLRSKSPKSALANKFWTRLDQTQEMSADQAILIYTGAAKRLGRAVITWTDLEKNVLEKELGQLDPNETLCQIVRIALVINFPNKDFINEILRRGDDYEKAAVLKTLSSIDPKGEFCDLAVDSCRTNSSIVFSAIAQRNSYPAQFFPDNQITHLALKTIFMDLDFSQIDGLNNRACDSLKIALVDLYEERLAAGRSLPEETIKFMRENSFIS